MMGILVIIKTKCNYCLVEVYRGKNKASFDRCCPWLIVNEEVCYVVPHVAVVVEVVHGGLQRGLEGVGVILKQPQDDAPHQGGEEREGVMFRLRDESFLYSQSRQGEQDPGQQVHVDLRWRGKELHQLQSWLYGGGVV